jgi:hypothetical protein
MLGHQAQDPDPDPGSGSGIRIRNLEKMLDPESESAIRKNAGSGSVSGSALNQCGSETLVLTIRYLYLPAWKPCCHLPLRGRGSPQTCGSPHYQVTLSASLAALLPLPSVRVRLSPNMSQSSLSGNFICQPGSPVATSLCEGEALPKHVAVLTIR